MKLQPKRARGVTLIELTVTLSVVALLISLAVPSWDALRQKRDVTQSAEQLSAFLSSIQGVSVKHNNVLTVSLEHTGPTNWCLGAVLGATACDCRIADPGNSAYCAIEGSPQRLIHEQNRTSRMTSHSADAEFSFEPVRGIMIPPDLATSHFYTFSSKDSLFSLRVNISASGRVRSCSNEYDKQVPGYRLCPGVVEASGPPGA